MAREPHGRRRPGRSRLAVRAGFSALGLVVLLSIWVLVVSPKPEPRGSVGVPEAGVSTAQRSQAEKLLLRNLPSEQVAATRDRVVSDEEYRAAVVRAMGCLRQRLIEAEPGLTDQDVRLVGPERSIDGFSYSYGFSFAVPTLDPRPIDRACQDRFSAGIESLFHLEKRSDPAYMGRVGAAFHYCLDRAHLPGDHALGPRNRFLALLENEDLTPAQTASARRCIGAYPSIGDLDL